MDSELDYEPVREPEAVGPVTDTLAPEGLNMVITLPVSPVTVSSTTGPGGSPGLDPGPGGSAGPPVSASTKLTVIIT